MSDDEHASAEAAGEPETAEPETTGSRRSAWGWLREELGLGLELAALAAFAFSRPVLDAFGGSPETFVINRATSGQIIWFGVLVALVPALVAVGVTVAVGGLTRWLVARWRIVVHAVLIAVLAGVGANRMGQDQTGWPWSSTRLLAVGILVAVGVGLLRWWSRSAEVIRTFLRFGSVAVLVFAFQFLAASPTGELALGTGPVVNAEHAAEVAEQLGDSPPPVVMVVFDALPTMMLLDGEGEIDADLYPNFARLAGDGTFYNNTTTVSGFTGMAVPTLMRGVYPERSARPAETDENIFTLLGGSYDVQALEQVTRYCPAELCGHQGSGSVTGLLDEATGWWVDGATTEAEEEDLNLIAALNERYEEVDSWIDNLQFGVTNRPELLFLHTIMPHNPWQYTDEGAFYEAPDPATGTAGAGWTEAGWLVGHQRQVLQAQASDLLLGQLFDRLEDEGVYDDALVVVTADHGASFRASTPHRSLTPENAAEVAFVPLLVKEPGQEDGGRVEDGPVESVDVLPTVTDVVGVEPFWELDGMPADVAVTERSSTRQYVTHEFDGWSLAPDDEVITFDADDYRDEVISGRPPVGEGPDGAWQVTEHGELVGEPVDDLPVGEPVEPELQVTWSQDFGSVDLDEPLGLEVVTDTELPDGEVVAFTLNGTVAGMGQVQEWTVRDGNLLHAMLRPDLFEEGENEFGAYLVEGPVGDETLRPLELDFG